MPQELNAFISGFWMIFSFSFLVALTGAMSPGPLLTYTIIKSARTERRGYLMGLWIIAGHALLEAGIVLFLLLGFSFVFQKLAVVRGIGLAGGILLVLFGLSVLRDLWKGAIDTDFLNPDSEADSQAGGIHNPVLGGVLISMANPYWWVWWATIGLAFMSRFEISLDNWPGLLAFFLGHEAGDLLWYLIVSFAAFFGIRRMNPRVYCGILLLCGVFMIGFGLWLGLTPFFQTDIA